MSDTAAQNNGVRCPGRYEDALDAFGQTIHPQCIGCQRRTTGYPPGHWYFDKVPVFASICPQRLEATA